MDQSAIATATRRYMGELGSAYVTGTVLTDAINNAQSRLNTDTEFLKVDVTVMIGGGGREFAIPTAANDIYRVRLGTGTERVNLKPMAPSRLRWDDSGWEGGTAGTPTDYYTEGQYIGFDPKQRPIDKWARATVYAIGDRVRGSATDTGFIYSCLKAVTSESTEPTWPTTIDGTTGNVIIDNVWQQSGHTRVYLRTLKEPHTLSGGGSAPEWLPQRHHITIAKGAALELLDGFDSENQAADRRIRNLFMDYMSDTRRLKRLGGNRSREYSSRIILRRK